MSISAGPYIANNGLVLYLDASNIKSFRGEPTTNLAPYPDYSNRTFNQEILASSWGGDVAYVTYFPNGGYNNMPYKMLAKVAGGTGGSQLDDHVGFTIEDGKTYTISCYMKASRNVTINRYGLDINRIEDNYYRIATVDFDLTTEWQRIVWVYNAVTGHAGIYQSRQIIYNDDNLPLYIYWCGFQVEQKSYATPFANGTRGTTVATGGGWADLSGNANHGELLNGPIYDSDIGGSLIFDGSNDEIYVNHADNLNFIGNQQYTALAWIYPTLGGVTWHGVISKGNSQQYALTINSPNAYFHYETNQGGVAAMNSPVGSVSVNAWQYVGIRFDGSNKTIWKNGAIMATQNASTLNSTTNTEQLRLGEANNGEQFAGKISNVKIYNRALTLDEILQNYNATKSRYIV